MSPKFVSQSSADARPMSWQPLLTLSGAVSAVLLLVGFLVSGSDAPDYLAADQEWVTWADGNESKGSIGALLILLSGFVFLHFMGTMRSVLAQADDRFNGSGQLAGVVFAGGVSGITGITMATVTIAAASAEGADASPEVSRAVATATTGAFLVAGMGFAAMLAAAGLLTLRSGVFARWTGTVALVGAFAFFLTFFTLTAGTTKDSLFGYGFFPGFLALAIWLIATSVATYRTVSTTTRGFVAIGANS